MTVMMAPLQCINNMYLYVHEHFLQNLKFFLLICLQKQHSNHTKTLIIMRVYHACWKDNGCCNEISKLQQSRNTWGFLVFRWTQVASKDVIYN